MFGYDKPESKVSILFRGFARGIGIAILTSAALFVVGILLSLMGNAGWIHLGEDQPWMPLSGLVYGFPVGVVIGVIVGYRFSYSRWQRTI